jgi:flavodoxin
MKIAVVFYSYDGNCAFAAQRINTFTKADLVQISVKNEKKRSGFLKYFLGGMQATLGKKPALMPYDFTPDSYDLIILGTPVWAGSPSPAINSFLSKTKISGKKIALFICHAGGAGKTLNILKKALSGNEIIAETELINPSRDTGKASQQIEEWLKTFIKQ